MPRISLLIFGRDCMGCHACEVACKQEHRLPQGPRLVRVIERAPDFIPIYCHHCAHAPCAQSCPSEAIQQHEGTGAILIDPPKCIGCLACLEACPFGAMQFDEERGLAVKCDLCIDRLLSGGNPACASVCPTGCIVWGDISSIHQRIDGQVESAFLRIKSL